MRHTIPESRVLGRIRSGLLVTTLALGVVLAGCESLPGNLRSDYTAARAERLFAAGEFDAAAAGWMSLANSASGDQRDRYLLRAAESWLAGADRMRAAAALAQVSSPPAEALANDYHLGRAALAVFDQDVDAAVAALATADAQRFTLEQRAKADAVRGQIAFLEGDPAAAIALLVRRELWLGSESEIARNDQLIWEGLLIADPALLRSALAQSTDSDISGWLALGLLANPATQSAPSRGLVAWQRQYPGHPALRTVIPGFSPDLVAQGQEPQRIALLLPLSGRAQGFGSTIRDGVLSHYAQRYAGALSAPTIVVYDTTMAEPAVSYELAVNEGADLIIGPVLRANVDALATYQGPRVPTLLLNYPSVTDTYATDMYAFGLAPEDDARAAAVQAYAQGHRRAVALLPTGSRGERLLEAFNEQFAALGGAVLNYENFVPEAADHSNEIERLMLLTDSVARYRRIRDLIGAPLQFEPRRRADIDVIFLGANAENARQLKPQLRFHYAGDLPVIATSSVNDPGDASAITDLSGVGFAEIPWLLDAMAGRRTPVDAVQDALVNVRRQPRLFALGHDALTLALGIYSGTLPASGIDGATGHLSIRQSGEIARQPGWAQFVDGRPQMVKRRIGGSFRDTNPFDEDDDSLDEIETPIVSSQPD